MKKITIILMILSFGLSSSSQPSIQFDLGVSSHKSLVGGLQILYKINSIFIQIGYDAHINRNVNQGNYINGGLGYHKSLQYLFIEPYIGYTYIFKSSDKTYLNDVGMIYGLSLGKNINEGSLLLKGMYCKDVYFLILGIRYNF